MQGMPRILSSLRDSIQVMNNLVKQHDAIKNMQR
jgi:hypothetical protein